MKTLQIVINIGLTVIIFLGLNGITCQENNQHVLARIEDEEIKTEDFLVTLPKGQSTENAEEINSRFQVHLMKLINKKLFIQEAKRRGFVEKVGPSFELSKKTMLVYKLKNKEIKEKAKVTQDEVNKLYDILPIEVYLRVIITTTQDDADLVEKQLKNGMSFENCAKKFSLHPSNLNGGDVGFGKLAFLQAPIRNALENLEPGAMASPIQTNDGYYIIQLVARKNVPVKSFAQEEVELRNFLEQQKYRELHQKFYDKLNSRLTYNQKALQVFNKRLDQITDEEKELWVVKKDETLMVRVKSLLPVMEKFNPAIGPELRTLTIKSEIEDDMIYEEAKHQGLDQDPTFKKELNRILDDLLYQAFYDEEITKKILVSEPEILAYYADQKSNYPGGWSESVRSLIYNRILQERKKEVEANLTQQLRNKTKIEINHRLLKSLVSSQITNKEIK